MYKKSVFIAVVIFVLIALPAYAQNDGPASQLQELINQLGAYLVALVVAFMGMLSTRLTSWVRSWPIFKDEDKSKIAGIVADIVSGLSSLVTTLIVVGAAYLGGLLENPETQTVLMGLVSTWLAAFGWHKVNKVAKGLSALKV